MAGIDDHEHVCPFLIEVGKSSRVSRHWILDVDVLLPSILKQQFFFFTCNDSRVY